MLLKANRNSYTHDPLATIAIETTDGRKSLEVIEAYDVLVHVESNANAAKAVIGTYRTENQRSSATPGATYSTTIHFPSSLPTVPRVLVALTKLQFWHSQYWTVRVQSFSQNVCRENFICTSRAWLGTMLYNVGVDWIAIEESGWQSGVFGTGDITGWTPTDILEHRIDFAKPFEDGPPMVFVAFNTIDLDGPRNMRAYAASIDYRGFNLAVLRGEESETIVHAAAVTWIAIPASDVMKKRNAWIGSFASGVGGTGSQITHDHPNRWDGHVDFGFEFKRSPKIFVGLSQMSAAADKQLQLGVTTSDVTTSGMNWRIESWDDTMLRSAGANFIAVDTDYC
ncbi:hypothetical protein MD484_g7825, partial [Candolleomyces efflorescens]